MILHFVQKSLSDAFAGKEPLLAARPEATDHAAHLDAASDWLMRSVEACGGEASSKGYRFLKGWMPPYPETTGYIIPTLLALGDRSGEPKYAATAERMSNWLVGIQRSDGGFSGYELGRQEAPDVFDTGMILLGFNALLLRGNGGDVAQAAGRSAEFLRGSLDQDGAFSRYVSHDMFHCYNVRSAWALVAYGRLSGNAEAVTAGLANADWALAQQEANGFFAHNAFKPGGNANTHGTAYVLRGLFQIHLLTDREDILAAVLKAAEHIVARFEKEGWIAAELGPDWSYLSRHICLTGCAQLAIVFLRLAAVTGEDRFSIAAERLIAQVAASQELRGRHRHSGAIAGSRPIFGAYAPLQYPNWATKFFADSLLERERWHQGIRKLPEQELYGG